MPTLKDVPLNALSMKTFAELQDFLAKKTDLFDISKGIIVTSEVAQNQRKQTYRRLILAFFEQKDLYLCSIEEDYNNQSGEPEITLGFSNKKPNQIIFKNAHEEKPYVLKYDPENFIDMGLRQFIIFSEIQSMGFKEDRFVPLYTIAEQMWNGGAMIGKNTDPLEPCVSASTVNQFSFIFKSTEIPAHHIKLKPKFKCDKNMILVSASRIIKEEVGTPCLIVETVKTFDATNTVIAIKIKPEFSNIGYLARLTKFMNCQDFRKQLFPQKHDKSWLLSIKNLKVVMVPDPTIKNHEDEKLVRAIEDLRIADKELKGRQRECDLLFHRNP